MGLDLGRAAGTHALFRVPIEQAGEEVLRGGRDDLGPREMQGLREDLSVHLVGVLVVEGREARQHLVEQDAQRPPVDRLGVALAEQQLGREVLGSAAESCEEVTRRL